MSNSNRCPDCSSNNTRRCAVVYEAGVSTVEGPRYTTVRTSSTALKAAPPVRPVPPVEHLKVALFWWAAALAFAAFGVSILLSYQDYATPAGLALAALLAVWLGWPPAGSLDKERYEQSLNEYSKDLALYKQLWMCGDCGKIFMPKRAP